MSCRIRTVTPFINQDILVESLENLGYQCSVDTQNSTITFAEEHGYKQIFALSGDKYVLDFYSYRDRRSEAIDLIKEVEKEYAKVVEEKAEEERRRIEDERKKFVENQKKEVIERAKKLGYSAKEEYVKGKIKVVLVRQTY